MLLRLTFAALVAANLVYFAWTRGSNDPAAEREPQRLQQQLRPELLELQRPPPDAPR